MVEKVIRDQLYWYGHFLIKCFHTFNRTLNGKVMTSFIKDSQEEIFNIPLSSVLEFRNLNHKPTSEYCQFFIKDLFTRASIT
jgi:hypothetical protein